MSFFKNSSVKIGIVIIGQNLTLLESEHGTVFSEPVVVAGNPLTDIAETFGYQAITHPDKTLRYPLQTASFSYKDLMAMIHWAIRRITIPDRAHIVMPVQNLADPYYFSFWTQLLSQIGVASFSLLPPTAVMTHESKGILYLAEGLAEMGLPPEQYCGAISYGRYLSRALGHYIYQNYQLLIDETTAIGIGNKLSSLIVTDRQVTVSGTLPSGEESRIMLVSEELLPVFRSAFQPVIDECQYQLALRNSRLSPHPSKKRIEQAGFLLNGTHSAIPGLAHYFSEQLQLPFQVSKNPEKALVNGLEKYLKQEKRAKN